MTRNVSPIAPRYLPLLILMFIGSGAAALIYEIVWFQLLQLVIGSSAISLAALLGTFMGGMCLGSLAYSRVVAPSRHPLRMYALLELGLAVSGVVVLLAVPAVTHVYTTLVGHGMPGILLRAAVCAVCLLPPTVLMGATLPAIARWVEASPRGTSWLGFFYGGNIIGAVGGCLLAGFYLLRVHDVVVATGVAVVLNLAVSLIVFLLSGAHVARSSDAQPVVATGAGHPDFLSPSAPARPAVAPPTRTVLAIIGLSGFCALGCEVIWTRVLSLFLGATVYTFSLILAVFLFGLAIGSSAGAALARHSRRPGLALGCCQGLQALAIAWAAYMIASALPYWPVSAAADPWAKFHLDLVRCGWGILPSAILWGASFPLALAAIANPAQDSAWLVGRTYAANTLGAIAGAVLTGMVFIPALGTQWTQQGFILVSVLGAVLLLWRSPVAMGALVLAACAAFVVPPIPWKLVAYGRQLTLAEDGSNAIYLGEGMNASVAVSETFQGARLFHVSGKTEASSLPKDMRLQRMLGHLPALLHPQPRSVLIVGCGAGITAGSFVLHPSIERIVICDIEPLIPQVVATYFQHENHDVLRDPRVEIVYDDARHYIATTREKFDIITSDPIHPWVKGSAVLYSREYFDLCKRRLQPGGLITQWVPLYESDRAVIQSELATFFAVFPHGTIWANDDDGYGYDTVVLGGVEPLTIDIDGLQRRLDRPDHADIVDSLADLDLGSALDLLATYAGRRADLTTWLTTAEINHDRNLRLQYLAGLQLESIAGADTYDEILSYRQFPADLFQAPEHTLEQLRTMQGVAR